MSAPRTMRREFCPNADACVRGFAALGRDRAARRSQLGGPDVAASLRPVGGCPARISAPWRPQPPPPRRTTRRSRRRTTPPSAPSRILRTLFRGLYEEADAPEEEAAGPAPAEAPACITDEASVASLRMELQTEPWFDAKQRGDPAATKALARKRAQSIATRLETQRTQADDLLKYMKGQTTRPN